MARWDDETIKTQDPPKDIMCANCKYRLKPITVGGYTQDRAGYGKCEKYENKPKDIIWNHALCTKYEEE